MYLSTLEEAPTNFVILKVNLVVEGEAEGSVFWGQIPFPHFTIFGSLPALYDTFAFVSACIRNL